MNEQSSLLPQGNQESKLKKDRKLRVRTIQVENVEDSKSGDCIPISSFSHQQSSSMVDGQEESKHMESNIDLNSINRESRDNQAQPQFRTR